MSGRAGRRGKDERGICIIMIDEQVILSVNLVVGNYIDYPRSQLFPFVFCFFIIQSTLFFPLSGIFRYISAYYSYTVYDIGI